MTVISTSLPGREGFPSAVLAVHNGALGDFLCCWPGLLAIARHFRREDNEIPLYFSGRAAMHPWALPLGYAPCPPNLQATVDSLYTEEQLPASLADSIIFWFCLDKPPALPCLKQALNRITPLTILNPPNLGNRELTPEPEHVLFTLKAHLEVQGIPWLPDWRQTWQNLFGTWQGQCSREIALLPGSGHRNKEWPMRYFKYLAEKLASQGWEPLFIIGEAERERGLLPPPGMKWEDPSPPLALAQRLRQVRAMVSNDAGPAHLAGMYNVPEVVLFGPTSPEVWGVPGVANLTCYDCYILNKNNGLRQNSTFSSNLNLNFNFKPGLVCSPCSSNLRNLNCPAPVCLESLSPETVYAALEAMLRFTS